MRQLFDPRFDGLGSTLMTVNGLHCTLNLPPAPKSHHDDSGEEIDQGLPPYGERPAFSVDDFSAACPPSWVRGSADEASFFVPVKPEHGLWLDFNANAAHAHDVAVRISIQGVCAVTGLPTKGRSRLEQYREKCPVHDEPFSAERFCARCGFKWPDQNYLATTGTPRGYFWLDGFRAKDGRVREFVFTEETARGVAAQIIGNERVFAIGIAFYLSKQPKPKPDPVYTTERSSSSVFEDYVLFDGGGDRSKSYQLTGNFRGGPSVSRAAAAPQLEIAAGARIRQQVYRDPNDLDYWQDEPAGTIYIAYCDEDTARTILAAGREDRTGHGEGFMDGLTVGHPSHGKTFS